MHLIPTQHIPHFSGIFNEQFFQVHTYMPYNANVIDSANNAIIFPVHHCPSMSFIPTYSIPVNISTRRSTTREIHLFVQNVPLLSSKFMCFRRVFD